MNADPVAVVLSDLHLGSIQSKVGPDAATQKGVKYEDYIDEFLLNKIPNAKFLILNGDTIDFSLNGYDIAFMRAAPFFQTLARNGMRKFEQIIFIPGNHDHNIWQLVQHEVKVTRPLTNGNPPQPYPHVQAGFLNLAKGGLNLPGVSEKSGALGDFFLKGLFKLNLLNTSNEETLPIAVVFPNLFLFTEEESPNYILITHGHFFCLPWILVTEIFKKNAWAGSLLDLENFNVPLTELGWTALGQAGRVTSKISDIYDELRKGRGSKTARDVTDEAIKFIIRKKFPLFARFFLKSNILKYHMKWLSKELLKFLQSSKEYKDSKFLESYANKCRINKYLNFTGELYSENILGIKIDKKKDEVTFPKSLIFGHTHKPVRSEIMKLNHKKKEREISVYNSGGFIKGETGADAIIIYNTGKIESRLIWSNSRESATPI